MQRIHWTYWAGILVQSFRSTALASQALTCVALAGNMFVAAAWFGPALHPAVHAYGAASSPLAIGLGCFWIAQVLLVWLALLPAGAWRIHRGGAEIAEKTT